MMSSNITIYSDWSWDDIFATAILALALTRKGYKVFLEFPSPLERRNLILSKCYCVGITHRDGATLINSTALEYLSDRKLGLVLRYDGEGRSNILMRLVGVNSLTEVALEYIQTLNENISIPEQILNDVIAMNTSRLDKLSRIGKIMYKAFKVNYSSKEFRSIMYSFAYTVVNSKTLKIPEQLNREAEKYEKALELLNELIKNKHYIELGSIKVVTISSSFNDEFIKQNISLLRAVGYDALLKLCRSDGIALLIQETELGYVMRICLLRRDISFVDIIKSIPQNLIDKLLVTLRGNHILIRFREPSNGSLDVMLDIASKIASSIMNKTK